MRLITVAIHTYPKAIELKRLLENEGISVTLQNVNLENPGISPGMRVRIAESDLPLALRIIENTDIFMQQAQQTQLSGHFILVPVDGSEHALNAAIVAVHLGAMHKMDIVLLNAYTDPYIGTTMQLSDALTFDLSVDAEARRQVEQSAHAQMNILKERLHKMMAADELPTVKIIGKVVEGVPEDAIRELEKINAPYLIVMGTRDSKRKIAEMIGSVTGEVLDKGRSTVLTIPESFRTADSKTATGLKPRNIVFVCNLDQQDIIALDTMIRIFEPVDAKVTLTHIPGRRRVFTTSIDENINRLISYCRDNYPSLKFEKKTFADENNLDQFLKYVNAENVDLIVVPNRKRNAFARFVSPALANRILFSCDTPMLVIRV